MDTETISWNNHKLKGKNSISWSTSEKFLQWEQIFESQKNLTLESPSLAPAPDFGQDQNQKYSNREAKGKKERKIESKWQLVLYKGVALLFHHFLIQSQISHVV